MDDNRIIDLYWARSEEAICQSEEKYGAYCYTIAHNILENTQDSEECVSDTWLRAWDSMPPQRPERLRAFLGRITRNLSLDRLRARNAARRDSGQTLPLDELQDCVPAPDPAAALIDDMALAELLNRFLAALPEGQRRLFLGRYWYFESIPRLASAFSMPEGRVRVTLFRLRKKLKTLLEKEGVAL